MFQLKSYYVHYLLVVNFHEQQTIIHNKTPQSVMLSFGIFNALLNEYYSSNRGNFMSLLASDY
jgi:hypothetical protein